MLFSDPIERQSESSMDRSNGELVTHGDWAKAIERCLFVPVPVDPDEYISFGLSPLVAR